jgi:hypothetical protein
MSEADVLFETDGFGLRGIRENNKNWAYFVCVCPEQTERALRLIKISDWNVSRVDHQNRAPIKGVISGVSLEGKAKDITEEVDGMVGARRLTCMVDGLRKPTSSILLSFELVSLLTYLGYVRAFCGRTQRSLINAKYLYVSVHYRSKVLEHLLIQGFFFICTIFYIVEY